MLIADDRELHPYGRVPAGLATARPGGSAAPRVLVVDGDRDLREAVAAHLRAAGFAVRTAADGLDPASGCCTCSSAPGPARRPRRCWC
jgi:hypothetical protein